MTHTNTLNTFGRTSLYQEPCRLLQFLKTSHC